MAMKWEYEVKFHINGRGDTRSYVKASDSAEAVAIAKSKYRGMDIQVFDVRRL